MDRSVSQSVDRRFIRHPSRLPISFALPNSASRPEECLRDVSEGGVCFASATELQVGSPIRLQIPVFGDQFEVDGNRRSVIRCDADPVRALQGTYRVSLRCPCVGAGPAPHPLYLEGHALPVRRLRLHALRAPRPPRDEQRGQPDGRPRRARHRPHRDLGRRLGRRPLDAPEQGAAQHEQGQGQRADDGGRW